MTAHQVKFHFSDNEKTEFSITEKENLLEKAEQHGVFLANDCREGLCGVCAGNCNKGKYELTEDTALSASEKDAGMVLPCTMHVSSDTEIHFDYPKSLCKPSENSTIATSVVSVDEVSQNTAKLVLKAANDISQLNYQPGQFVSMNIPGSNEWRSYSFANVSNADNVWEFIIRLLPQGVMSDYLRSNIEVGDNIELKHPKGSFYLREINRPALFFAGGTGISAIIVMLKQLAENGGSNNQPISLYYGVNQVEEFCCQDELASLQQALPNLTVHLVPVTANEQWQGATGFVTDLLSSDACFDGDADCYMCGPPPMLNAIKGWFKDSNITNTKFYAEKFVATQAAKTSSIAAEKTVIKQPDLSKQYKRAVVIGGSIAGIAAARVLSDTFQEVVVLERDKHHHIDEVRSSTPQAHHAHHLLQRGQRELDTLFPGFLDDLKAAGTQAYDSSRDYRIYQHGHWKYVYESGIPIMAAPRRVFETVLRRQLNKYNNISYRYSSSVDDVLITDGNTVSGVKLKDGEYIDADLVIDASGKNTSLPNLLAEHGFAKPEQTDQNVNIYYTTCLFELTPEQVPDWGMLLLYGRRPETKQIGYAALYGEEKRNLLITIGSYDCHKVVRSHEEFLTKAKECVRDDVYEFIKDLTPTTEIKTFKYPKMFRRHYEKLNNVPNGFIAIGDALGSADPISGAGMTKAVLEALELGKVLQRKPKQVNTITKKYYKKSARLFDYIWFVISEQNLRYPWVNGKRPFYTPMLTWYVNQVLDLASKDGDAFNTYLHVAHLNKHVLTLMKPKMFCKVLKNALFSSDKKHAITKQVKA
ncbi:FAD-binding oxidoreductase [Thalassomonas sp. M1454]|uniref:FAD-binding oxidoreductase n=1 Tax=Thalassomonas sp. M1454 TaxID=2594477 RepID=UPI00117E5EDE|nr:FAD-binding oxidoreductase [Thalassomonas sp. M1454]TRX56488.1 2Fe-2S iron-sulfur cluster binding domain-containing protein [Thalassomonas sp. M1454]